MECNDLKNIITSWQDSGTVEKNLPGEMEAHMQHCRNCTRQYERLLPFLKKDAGITPDLFLQDDYTTFSVKDRVMQKIRRLDIPGKPEKTHVRPYVKYIFAMAALILILIGAGWLFASRGVFKAHDEVIVQFELKADEAETVYLVGDFSDWDPVKIPLSGPDKNGLWKVKIPLKKHKTYNYNFLVNGDTWIPDPDADMIVDDGFGGINSIINL